MAVRATDLSETVFALCSGTLPSAVAVIRISGPGTKKWVKQHFQPAGKRDLVFQRGMQYGEIVDIHGNKIDGILLLSFVAPHSFTGDDVAEIQCHGSVAVVTAIQSLLVQAGARYARAGEFSYRALLNGKVTPDELDELADVFTAKEASDLERIFSRRERTLQQEIFKLRESLIHLLAILDTAVDFSEEYSSVVVSALPLVHKISHDLGLMTLRYSRFRSGTASSRLVIAGRPNAGKSSLFNVLVGRYRAIVHEKPGTTRDVIEEDIVIGNRSWRVGDTAGIRPLPAAGVESKGIELGQAYLSSCRFWVLVVDGSTGLKDDDQALLVDFGNIPHLIVWNKRDLPEWKSPPDNLVDRAVSCHTLDFSGIESFMGKLSEALENLEGTEKAPLPTSVEAARLNHVRLGLLELGADLEANRPPEFISERARSLVFSLDTVIGTISTEDVLERVFGEFCVGK